MSEKILRFAVFGNEYQTKKSTSIQKVLSVLQARGAEIIVDRPFMQFLENEHVVLNNVTVFDGDDFSADYVISMGGDGTLLKAAARVGAKNMPIIGVNIGRLGFLSDVMPSEIEKAVDAIYKGQFSLQKHSVIEVVTKGEEMKGCRFALNDIAVLKRDSASMITIRAAINNEYLTTYQADGLIVTTPTGSTAYNLSNGGPIIVPDTDVLCLTPVAPHSLNIRPIVVDGNSEIELSIESRSHSFLIAVDGRSEKLNEATNIIIRKAAHSVNIVKIQSKHYYSTLREKMMWGADSRG